MKIFFQDWDVNRGNRRSQLVLLALRIAQQFHHFSCPWRWIGYPYFACYEILIVWLLGIEINYKATIGPRLRLFHGIGTVIHENVVIGADVTLRHLTTIGTKHDQGKAPIIGDHVDIGCHSVLLGAIHIGERAVIGAASVVLKDVPARTTVAGNPAQQL